MTRGSGTPIMGLKLYFTLPSATLHSLIGILLLTNFIVVPRICFGSPSPPAYRVVDLRSVPQSIHAFCTINNQGDVTGESDTNHVYLYRHGVYHDLGTLFGGRESVGYAINDRGDITGQSEVMVGNTPWDARREIHAFLASPDGIMADLGTLPGGHESRGRGINNQGEVVGDSYGRAFLYKNGKMVDLNSLIPADSGWTLGTASGINDAGQIVGTGRYHLRIGHGFLYSEGKITDMGALSGTSQDPKDPGSHGGSQYYGGGINDQGDAIGTSERALSDGSAFLYSKGRLIRFETRAYWSGAEAINNLGQVVGSFAFLRGGSSGEIVIHAFLFTGGRFVDLNTLIPKRPHWLLEEAYGINDRGEIVGIGDSKHHWGMFLLKPIVPTPYSSLPPRRR